MTRKPEESIIKWVVVEVSKIPVRIVSVTPDSPAEKAGIQPDEILLSINGEIIQDEIDYQALSSSSRLSIRLQKSNSEHHVQLVKAEWVPLGLCLDETKTMQPRPCCNHCLFCFIDQLPQGMRSSLYVKDDDWRHSLMMGNYVTLTNVSDTEFQRILKRKASPLYISVHATDPSVRCRMLRNPKAGNLMERLRLLKKNGLDFHCQVVLCPGINDGEVLNRTIDDLVSLYPAAKSLAIVPVGLTNHRSGLKHLQAVDSEGAARLLSTVHYYQSRLLREIGTRFVFASDEFYCICHQPIPQEQEYEDYPQIENGVGMLRMLEEECDLAFRDLSASERKAKPRRLVIPTGVSAQPFIQKISEQYAPLHTHVEVIAVKNHFFGETITVTGLIVGQDLVSALRGIDCDEILICDTMLREHTDRFLDNMSLSEVQQSLGRPLRVVRNDGESLIRALCGMEEEHD